MRLFVGIELPAHIRDDLASHVSRCSQRLPLAKWVPSESYHITLSFVGEVDKDLLPRFNHPLSLAAGEQQSFRLQLFKAGYFPRGRKLVRVAWVGVEDEAPIVRLQKSVADELQGANLLEEEHRRYHTHVTVARCRKPWGRSDGDSWESSLEGPLGEDCEIDKIVLFRSHLESNGARYHPVRSYPFGALK